MYIFYLDMLQYLEKDLNTVDSALFAPLDEAARPQAWRLLEMLGVRRLQPTDIIHHHILPALRASDIMVSRFSSVPGVKHR